MEEVSQVFYTFAVLFNEDINLKDFSKIDGNKKWKYIRFELEIKYKLFSTKATNINNIANNVYLPCNSFLTGYRFQDFAKNPFRYCELNEIDDDDILTDGEIIILVRKPMPLGFDFYNPPKESQNIRNWTDLYNTENEAMDAFITHACSSEENQKKPIKCHSSSFKTSKMPVPPKKYVCTNCWKPGHFRQYCQQIGQTDISMTTLVVKKPLPSGIPMVNFVKIDEETFEKDEKIMGKIIYYDKENNFYSYRKTH